MKIGGRAVATPGGRGDSGTVAAEGGEQAFIICGGIYLAAAAAVAVAHLLTPLTRGGWLIAYLSLVGGVAQWMLGAGLLAVARGSGARAPARGARHAQLVLWNGGTAAVAIADLVPAAGAGGVLAGSALLVAALILFFQGLREVRASARHPAPWWIGTYALLLVFLAASVVVGVLLAYARGR